MSQRILLDLFCGRWGWSRAFAKRGWHCIGVDLIIPPEVPQNCEFVLCDVLECISTPQWVRLCGLEHFTWFQPDAIVASSPCEEFSVHGMKHFHPHPKHPENVLRLFTHTRNLCEAAGVPWVMENVRAAQQFVGDAVHHCGPFYLWGNAVPPILNQGIGKDMSQRRDENGRRRGRLEHVTQKKRASEGATIPPELANCVADYIERLLEMRDHAAAAASS
jgi:hypothetical protein